MERKDINELLGMTEEELEREAAQFESGAWEGGLRSISVGRPRLYDEDMGTVSFRLPASQQQAVAAASERLGISRSEFFRNAIDHELMACSA